MSHLEQAFSLRAQLREFSPDLVISNGTLGFFGSTRWPRIHVFHGTMVAHSLADRASRSYRDWLIKGVIGGGLSEILSGLGSFRVAVSKSCAREMRRFYLLKADRVIPNGVHIPEIAKTERRGYIFVGRRESRKGYELAIQVAQAANVTLSVAGPGTDTRTHDLGTLDSQQLRELYATSEAMIFPSNYEACSLAILEALSNGCPVITTSVGWIPELLTEVPNYMLLLGDAKDVATFSRPVQLLSAGDEAVLKAVEDAVAWTRENNSYERFSERWLKVVKEVLDVTAKR